MAGGIRIIFWCRKRNHWSHLRIIRERYQIEDSIFENAFFFSENPFCQYSKQHFAFRTIRIRSSVHLTPFSLKFDLLNIKDTANFGTMARRSCRYLKAKIRWLIRQFQNYWRYTKYLFPFKENIDIFLLPSAGQNARTYRNQQNSHGFGKFLNYRLQRISQTVAGHFFMNSFISPLRIKMFFLVLAYYAVYDESQEPKRLYAKL